LIFYYYYYYYYYYIRLTAFFPRQPGLSRHQKAEPFWSNQSGFTEARDSEWQWHQLGYMPICTLPQTDNHASTPPLSFYRLDALPAAEPLASTH